MQERIRCGEPPGVGIGVGVVEPSDKVDGRIEIGDQPQFLTKGLVALERVRYHRARQHKEIVQVVGVEGVVVAAIEGASEVAGDALDRELLHIQTDLVGDQHRLVLALVWTRDGQFEVIEVEACRLFGADVLVLVEPAEPPSEALTRLKQQHGGKAGSLIAIDVVGIFDEVVNEPAAVLQDGADAQPKRVLHDRNAERGINAEVEVTTASA